MILHESVIKHALDQIVFFTILDSTGKNLGKKRRKNRGKNCGKKVQKTLHNFSRETLINLNRIYNVAPPLAPPEMFATFSGFYLSLRSFLMQLGLGSICTFMWVVRHCFQFMT